MPRMTNYLESGLIQHLFRTGSFTKPTVIAIALCSGAVVDTDTGALLTKELGGGGTPGSPPGGYNRQTLNPLDANWDAITQVNGSGLTSNTSTLTFGPATADWGTVSYVAVVDNSGYGSGNVLMYGQLQTAKTVGNGDSLQIAAGALDIYFD
jgi:hypothetical protein